jgi:hypothetical protein
MVFKIKLEDKAAFLNRMEKQGQAIDTQEIKNNKLEGYFEVTINNPEQEKMAKDILKQSPKINTIKEMKKSLTKNELKEMIRQELTKKKKKLDETELNEMLTGAEQDILNILGYAAGAAGIGFGAYIRTLFKKAGEKEAEIEGKDDEEVKQAGKKALQDLSNKLGRITGAGQ